MAASQEFSLRYIDRTKIYDRDAGLTEASGVTLSATGDRLWVVSDRGKSVFRFDPHLGTATSAPLTFQKNGEPRRVKNAEGVAFDPGRERLYIVTDQGTKSRLCTFQVE